MGYRQATALLARMLAVSATTWAPAQAAVRSDEVPRYDHIFVIVGENKGYSQLMEAPELTPNLHRLAAQYGIATQFYGEAHSSEGNYIAMLAGDTFGIHDDDAFYCGPGVKDEFCEASAKPHYVSHSIHAESLMHQLSQRGLTWKGYFEDLPAAGSLVPRWPNAMYPEDSSKPQQLYAAKHNGFVNFADVHDAPYRVRARHFVDFRQLDADLASGDLPNYAHIVPNQCNEMHGLGSDAPTAPEGRRGDEDPAALIRRGDAEFGMLVDKITRSKAWAEPGNFAIVITFDENNKEERKSGPQGCCGYDPRSLANFGGGHVVTIVITNHGPKGLADATPYNHYSLLRTTEVAFGIGRYLRHAADRSKGMVSMTPLFAVTRPR